jgi:ribonuclease R
MVKKKFLKGIIKRNPDGFGFLIPDSKDHQDVYIPRHAMDGVMTNDYVLADVYPESGSQKFRGEIVEIIKRSTVTVVGKYKQITKSYGILKDESNSWGSDLVIETRNNLECQTGDLVAAQIIQYPEKGKELIGKVVEIIGNIEDPLNDIKRVALTQQITMNFPEDVLKEAKKYKSEPNDKDFKGRKDIRDLNLITIDGKTAKDFDDAVYVERSDRGFRLLVAIADVSHYVKDETAIDEEAYLRGNSIYFPNFVIPMLPEVLSNGLCSLNPHVPRLCMVAEMYFDFAGTKAESRFYEAVMESKARITYGEAQEIIEGQKIEKFEHVKENILKCAELAKILMAKRFRDGSLDLEIPETTLEIDASGVPVDVIRSERLFAHRLIEELMLIANVSVAEFLTNSQIPSMYRIHEPPNEVSIKMLERYLHNFGGKVKLDDGKLQKRLTRALQEFSGKPEAHVLNILTLRSMNQAKYSVNNVGHFGLGFDNYTHFTSPIRRYPDLIVHRLIKSQILKGKKYNEVEEEDLATAATWLSSCEQKAAKAERQITAIKKARFMEKFLGDEFEGMISSVVRFGVFVLLREYEIDGLVKIDELSSQRLEFDEKTLSLYNKKTGLRFTIGDAIKIKVVATDSELGQINFMPLELVAKREQQNMDQIKQDSRRNPNGRQPPPSENQNPNQANVRGGGGSGGGKKFKNKRGGSFAERMFKKKDKVGFGQANSAGNKNRPQFQQASKNENRNKDAEQTRSDKDFKAQVQNHSQNKNQRDEANFETPYEIKQGGDKNSNFNSGSGVEYRVQTSKRSSILEKLDQAIQSRSRNESFSGGVDRKKPQSEGKNSQRVERDDDRDRDRDNNRERNPQRSFKDKEKNSGGSGAKTESSRKNSKKRGQVKNHRRGVR